MSDRLDLRRGERGRRGAGREPHADPHRSGHVRGRVGGLQPDAHRRGDGPGGRACRACSVTACSRWACSARALTDYVGVGNLRSYKVRFTKQTWPDEELTTKIVVTGTREEDGEKLVDLECSVANDDGEVKVAGDAVRWPRRSD